MRNKSTCDYLNSDHTHPDSHALWKNYADGACGRTEMGKGRALPRCSSEATGCEQAGCCPCRSTEIYAYLTVNHRDPTKTPISSSPSHQSGWLLSRPAREQRSLSPSRCLQPKQAKRIPGQDNIQVLAASYCIQLLPEQLALCLYILNSCF